VKRGDKVPDNAIVAGQSSRDGVLYVGRVESEVGKYNTVDGCEGSNVHNLWIEKSKWMDGAYAKGEILTLAEGWTAEWVAFSAGDELPDSAFVGGHSLEDGMLFVGRVKGPGEVGKVRTSTGTTLGTIASFHARDAGDLEHGEILCIRKEQTENPPKLYTTVRQKDWYSHYRHTVFHIIGEAIDHKPSLISIIGIKPPHEAKSTSAEFPALMECIRSAYEQQHSPFFHEGEERYEFAKISETRIPIKFLEEELEFRSKGGKIAIVVSCGSDDMKEAQDIITRHNTKDGLSRVRKAWATSNDVYSSLQTPE